MKSGTLSPEKRLQIIEEIMEAIPKNPNFRQNVRYNQGLFTSEPNSTIVKKKMIRIWNGKDNHQLRSTMQSKIRYKIKKNDFIDLNDEICGYNFVFGKDSSKYRESESPSKSIMMNNNKMTNEVNKNHSKIVNPKNEVPINGMYELKNQNRSSNHFIENKIIHALPNIKEDSSLRIKILNRALQESSKITITKDIESKIPRNQMKIYKNTQNLLGSIISPKGRYYDGSNIDFPTTTQSNNNKNEPNSTIEQYDINDESAKINYLNRKIDDSMNISPVSLKKGHSPTSEKTENDKQIPLSESRLVKMEVFHENNKDWEKIIRNKELSASLIMRNTHQHQYEYIPTNTTTTAMNFNKQQQQQPRNKIHYNLWHIPGNQISFEEINLRSLSVTIDRHLTTSNFDNNNNNTLYESMRIPKCIIHQQQPQQQQQQSSLNKTFLMGDKPIIKILKTNPGINDLSSLSSPLNKYRYHSNNNNSKINSLDKINLLNISCNNIKEKSLGYNTTEDNNNNNNNNIHVIYDNNNNNNNIFPSNIRQNLNNTIRKDKKYKDQNSYPLSHYIMLSVQGSSSSSFNNSNNNSITLMNSSNQNKDKSTVCISRYTLYYEFMAKINYSNLIFVAPVSKFKQTQTYKYQVLKGNNHSLVKSCFKSRWWWSPAKKSDNKSLPNLHFLWSPWRNNNFIDSLKIHENDIIATTTATTITAATAASTISPAEIKVRYKEKVGRENIMIYDSKDDINIEISNKKCSNIDEINGIIDNNPNNNDNDNDNDNGDGDQQHNIDEDLVKIHANNPEIVNSNNNHNHNTNNTIDYVITMSDITSNNLNTSTITNANTSTNANINNTNVNGNITNIHHNSNINDITTTTVNTNDSLLNEVNKCKINEKSIISGTSINMLKKLLNEKEIMGYMIFEKNYRNMIVISKVAPENYQQKIMDCIEKINKKQLQLQQQQQSRQQQQQQVKSWKSNLIQYVDPNAIKICNHLEKNFHLSNKKALYYNLKNYYLSQNLEPFDYIPLTFHIQHGIEDVEYKKFLDYYEAIRLKMDQKKLNSKLTKQNTKSIKDDKDKYCSSPDQKTNQNKVNNSIDSSTLTDNERNQVLQHLIPVDSKNVWIIKPGENTNRGMGITVTDDLKEIKNILSEKVTFQNGKSKTYIIQKYIEKPLLYNKRKFDIRCYILLTSINGIQKGYWYQDGYIRTSSTEFDLSDLSDKMIHLTNDAIQKYSEDYGKFESGNKISYTDFQKYIDINYADKKINFMENIYPKMKSLALDAIKSVFNKIDPHRREYTFEVFGLDYMIDDKFKPFLIEINTNPCLELSSPLLARIIPSMIENVFRLVIDPLFPPPYEWPNSRKGCIPENCFESNKFDLIFDEREYEGYKASLDDNQLGQKGILEFDEDDMDELYD